MNLIAVMRSAAAVLSLVFCVTVAEPALAQEPSAASMSLAKEMVVLKGVNQMLDPVVPGVIESGKNMFMQTSPQLSKDLNEVAANLRKEFELKREEITNIMARAYAQKFTEAELKEMLTFYKTPVGKKIITDEPQIIQSAMSSVQVWATAFSEQMISRIRADMKKKGHDL